MNLIDLFTRRDPTFAFDPATVQTRVALGGYRWRGLSLAAGHQMRLSHFISTHPLWSRPDSIGWYALSRNGPATLEIAFEQAGKTVSAAAIALSDQPVPVLLPWPDVQVALDDDTVLRLSLTQGPDAEIVVHRMLSRDGLYARARGTGIELGPGPRPQIHNAQGVSVTYLEETPPERWLELYDGGGKYNATVAEFPHLVVGVAADIPAEDASLDFIFSSHVFEHLCNPLGHLQRWHAKLAPGGLVIGVVPELTATKDRHMRPCGIDEHLAELEAGLFEPQPRHFDRYAVRLSGGRPDPVRARAMQDNGESIHVHFYDRASMARLLQEAVDRFGYRGFELTHTANHKDFHFVLSK